MHLRAQYGLCIITLTNYPLFSNGRFSPLSRVDVIAILQQLLRNANAMPFYVRSYATHRMGAATTAAAAGLPTTLIKTLGRWKSNAYETYVQYPTFSIRAVSSILAHTNASTQLAWNPDNHILWFKINNPQLRWSQRSSMITVFSFSVNLIC